MKTIIRVLGILIAMIAAFFATLAVLFVLSLACAAGLYTIAYAMGGFLIMLTLVGVGCLIFGAA